MAMSVFFARVSSKTWAHQQHNLCSRLQVQLLKHVYSRQQVQQSPVLCSRVELEKLQHTSTETHVIGFLVYELMLQSEISVIVAYLYQWGSVVVDDSSRMQANLFLHAYSEPQAHYCQDIDCMIAECKLRRQGMGAPQHVLNISGMHAPDCILSTTQFYACFMLVLERGPGNDKTNIELCSIFVKHLL